MKEHQKLDRGGRNLVMLGVFSVAIALVTVSISLLIYHNSGDIYLDRSRPGFLPDETEIEQENDETDDEEYTFEKSGEMTMETLEEYLTHLDNEVRKVDAHIDPFSADALSDETLGI